MNEAKLDHGNGYVTKVEKLFVKGEDQEEIRFSWWLNGRLMPRPADLPEKDWIELFSVGKEEGIFSEWFLNELKKLGE